MKGLNNQNVMDALLKYLNAQNRARLRTTSKGVRSAVNKNSGYSTPRASSPKTRSPPRAPKKQRR